MARVSGPEAIRIVQDIWKGKRLAEVPSHTAHLGMIIDTDNSGEPLDQAVATVEKSGAFSEIGKSGHGSGAVGAAEAKVEAIAKGCMEKDSSLDYASAMAKAWEDNPELMAEYEAEAGF